MILSYPKSRKTLIALISLTALFVVLILLLYRPENPEECAIIAIIVGSLGAFISVSSARFVMNSEILSLRYMLSNAISLERCAEELRSAARMMRKGSESRFQTAAQAADAYSAIGSYDEAIELLRDVALERPAASRSTTFLLAALRYSILKGDSEAADEYQEKLGMAISGMPQGMTRSHFEREMKPFSSFLSGEYGPMENRFHNGETLLIRLEAARLLLDGSDGNLRQECIALIEEASE